MRHELERKPTNDGVFAHLLGKEVFRPGLKLACPGCQQDFWRSVDDVRPYAVSLADMAEATERLFLSPRRNAAGA